jgi:hypothetical protein
MKERLITPRRLITTAATLAALYEISNLALTRSARKEAGRRDKWTCQGLGDEPCYQASLNGGHPAEFKDGFMITLAHYPETHHKTGKGYHDPNPENARCLCTLCHGVEEIDRGNKNGAQKMLNMGIYTYDAVRGGQDQVYLTTDQALVLREEARTRHSSVT